jgi:hypothetical protein
VLGSSLELDINILSLLLLFPQSVEVRVEEIRQIIAMIAYTLRFILTSHA